MKKLVALFGLSLMCLSLSACNNSNDSSSSSQTGESTTTNNSSVKLENDGTFERLTVDEGQEMDEMMEEMEYDKPEVKVEEDALVYKGALYYSGLEELKKLYKENPEVTRLKLESPGGVTLLGMAFGEFVHEHNLDVEVTGRVFSSAANYIFTAGKKIYLHKDSVVGFHGGAGDPTQPVEGMEDLTKEDREEYEANAKRGYNWQTELFKELGVDPEIVNLGQNEKFDKYSEDEKLIGWTYTLEAFEKLGLNNIELVDGEWDSPTDMGDGDRLFVIQADEVE